MSGPAAARPMGGADAEPVHVFPVRVFWEDTDAGGVVYYANYLRFAERARSELLRDIGVAQHRMQRETGVIFAVRRVEVDYLTPARLDDALEVLTTIAAADGVRVVMNQAIRRDGEELVRMSVEIVCVNSRGRATRMPVDIGAALARVVQGAEG